MGSVTIMCPRTGQQVHTGVEMSRYEFDAMPNIQATMHCWACGGEHNWSKRWATYVEGHAPAPDIDLSAAEAVRRRELYRPR
jgi:hypothetical protein